MFFEKNCCLNRDLNLVVLLFRANVLNTTLPKPTEAPLPRVSLQSCLSANDRSANEMLLGTVHISPAICLITEENPGKPQLGDRGQRLCDLSSPQMGSFTTI